MITLSVLGSGSSGNASVIGAGDVRVLLDAGLSARQIVLRLERLGLTPDDLTAVLLTHEHQDHSRGLAVLCRKHALPVYCTALTRECLAAAAPTVKDWKLIPSGGAFSIGGLGVESFRVPHDAADPQGFVFEHAGVRLGLLSDTGHVNNLVREKLRGVHALFVECNYDTRLLEADCRRPWSTKQRISSRHGHLSNEQTVELIRDIWHAGLESVILGHLSDDCNDPDLVTRVIREALIACGSPTGVHVRCASRNDITPTAEIRPPAPRPATKRRQSPQWRQEGFAW